MRIVLTSGAEFEGTYSNGLEPASCRLTMVQQKKLPNSADISNGLARREQAAMTFQRKDIAEARVISGNIGKNDARSTNGIMPLTSLAPSIAALTDALCSGNRSSFRTDAAISNSRPGAERPLKAWVPDTGYEGDGSLEKSSSTGAWDQFAENERLFGLKTDYDENIYTTAIDKSHPQYKERLAAAEKKAREIERSVPTTAHVAEERVMDFVGGDDQRDEEDKWVTSLQLAGAELTPFPDTVACVDRTSHRWRTARTSTRRRLGALRQARQLSRALLSILLSSRRS